MSSTHYMDLLMQNSPWNLILFMAIPVVLAETIAITELLIPLLSQRAELTKKVNRMCGVLAGIAFIGIILYLVPAVVLPLASNGEFRTWVDAVAIFSYLLAGIPMILLALLNLKLLFKHAEPKKRRIIRISLLAAFLVLRPFASSLMRKNHACSNAVIPCLSRLSPSRHTLLGHATFIRKKCSPPAP